MSEDKYLPTLSPEALADNEQLFAVLEDLLRIMHRRRDISQLTGEIRSRFPTPSAVFSAQIPIWEGLGMHPTNALLMGHLADVMRYLYRDSFGKHPRISRLEDASAYMAANAFGLQVERFYMLCVNGNGRLKALILLQEGTSDCALFNLRRMLSEVIRVKPAAVILTHNHPAGTLRPSQEDISCTLDALDALTTLSVPLLDHVIIAGDEAVSIRENGFIPESIWMRQNPDNHFLKNWFKPMKETAKAAKRPKKKSNA